ASLSDQSPTEESIQDSDSSVTQLESDFGILSNQKKYLRIDSKLKRPTNLKLEGNLALTMSTDISNDSKTFQNMQLQIQKRH
ncbi:MAG: hypothetical protein MHMPM18_002622, partial [Marteilia pararefringens]